MITKNGLTGLARELAIGLSMLPVVVGISSCATPGGNDLSWREVKASMTREDNKKMDTLMSHVEREGNRKGPAPAHYGTEEMVREGYFGTSGGIEINFCDEWRDNGNGIPEEGEFYNKKEAVGNSERTLVVVGTPREMKSSGNRKFLFFAIGEPQSDTFVGSGVVENAEFRGGYAVIPTDSIRVLKGKGLTGLRPGRYELLITTDDGEYVSTGTRSFSVKD